MLIEELYHKNPIVVDEDTPVVDALRIMIKRDINGLVIVDRKDDKKVLGILSIQDIAAFTVPKQFQDNVFMAAAMYRKGAFTAQAEKLKDKKVVELMRKNFIRVTLKDNIMAVTADFLKNDLYIVPVIEKGKLIGIVTRSEIKHALAYGMGIEKY